MGRKMIHQRMEIPAFGLAVVYSAILLLHLFFIPNFVAGSKFNGGIQLHSNTKAIYNLLRNDRTTFTENKGNHNTPKSLQLFVVSLAGGFCILYKLLSKSVQSVPVLAGKRCLYLSYRVMLI